MSFFLVRLAIPLFGLLGLSLTLVGLPGTWLTLAGAALAEWATEERLFSTWTLVAAVGLACVGELLEFLAAAGGARRAGASRAGAVGALIGGVLGAVAGTFLIPVPLVGTIAGGALGAFALSALAERGEGRPLAEALDVGGGAARGHALGLLGKLGAAVGVWFLLTVAAFWP